MTKSKLVVAGIVILGALVRGWYLFAPLNSSVTITPDEAVYGLQALHILKGEHSVFYWAQPYTGTFSAYLAAVLFLLFWVSRVALKIVPYLFSVGFVFLNYKLAREVFGSRKVALVAGLLSALGTPFWNNWSSRAGSGYPEAALVGNLVLLLVISLVGVGSVRGFAKAGVRGEPPNRWVRWGGFERAWQISVKLKFFLLGFLAGLGFWIQPTIVYYLVPAFAFWLIKRPRSFLSKNIFWLVLGVAVGGAPVWYANFFAGVGTAGQLFSKPWGIRKALGELFALGFPILLGTRSSWQYRDFFPPLAVGVWIFYGLGIIFLIGERVRNLGGFRDFRKRLGPIDLLLGTFGSTLVIFAFSAPFNQFVIEPRYILAFYSTLPLVSGWFLVKLWERHRVLGALAGALLLFNVVLGFAKAPPISFVDPYRLDKVIDFLEQRSLRYVNTNGALAHRLMFLTSERLIAAVREGGLMDARYHQYHKWVLEAPRDQQAYVYFVDSGELPLMRNEIDHFVTDWEEWTLDDKFVVLYPTGPVRGE